MSNASLGAYAEIVDNPAYRDDMRAPTLDALPDLLIGPRSAGPVGTPHRSRGRGSAGRRPEQAEPTSGPVRTRVRRLQARPSGFARSVATQRPITGALKQAGGYG